MKNTLGTSDERIQYLKDLQNDLFPATYQRNFAGISATRTLTEEEIEKIFHIVQEEKIICEMINSNMFGRIGLRLYEQPFYPGLPPEFLLTLIEEHIPGEGDRPRVPGSSRTDVWDLFSKYSHTEQNKSWLKAYKLKSSRERHSYDYLLFHKIS